jgi:hypothetical protein
MRFSLKPDRAFARFETQKEIVVADGASIDDWQSVAAIRNKLRGD